MRNSEYSMQSIANVRGIGEFCTRKRNYAHPLMLLSQLKTGQECVIVKILGHGAFRKRVMEMGFVCAAAA